jgi:hypothetical protein
MSTPDGLTFLETIAGYAQHIARNENPSANAPIRLAVIDPSYVATSYPGTLPKVTFEGEETVDDKRYVVVARDYMPGPGDRVVMLPVGHTYVILGCITPSYQPNLQRADLARRIFMDGITTLNLTSGQTGTSTVVSIGATMPNASYRTLVQQTDTAATNAYVFQVIARTTTTFTVSVRKGDNTAFSANATVDASWFILCTP